MMGQSDLPGSSQQPQDESSSDALPGVSPLKLVGGPNQIFTLQHAEEAAPLLTPEREREASPRRRLLAKDIVDGRPSPVSAFAPPRGF